MGDRDSLCFLLLGTRGDLGGRSIACLQVHLFSGDWCEQLHVVHCMRTPPPLLPLPACLFSVRLHQQLAQVLNMYSI